MSEKTEIKLEFLGTSGINSFIANTSSPRAVMDNSHISSRPSLINPDEVLIKTGIEYELGKYINDIRVENDCIVKAIVPRYREYGSKYIPTYTLLVEYEEDGDFYLDYINVDTYRSNHNFFGYELTPTEDFNNIEYNSSLVKDTVLATTSSLGNQGDYQYGINANTAFMSHPSVAEDGFVVSESFLQKLKFSSISKRIINLTKDSIPINLYGDNTRFKFIPDIGDRVREDGLLCAIRAKNDWLSVADLNTRSISEVDFTFDTLTYVNTDSIVIDVQVIKGNYTRNEFSAKMSEQLDMYAEMGINYYRTLVDKYEYIMREKKSLYGDNTSVKLTPRMYRYISDAMIRVNSVTNRKNKLCYRKLPIDQYRIEVTTLSIVTPSIGYKLTDQHASKGVICAILPDSHMPVDSNGNVADIITDNTSTISRMNLGRSYQVYLGSASRDNKHFLINYYTSKYGSDYLNKLTEEDILYFKEYITGFYALINPDMVEFMDSLNLEEIRIHLTECLTNQINIYYPPDNSINITDVITNIESSKYRPHLGKIQYTDTLGNRVTTKEDIRIGPLYFMLLDKVANDYSAVASSRVNHFGFPVKGTIIDKYKYPHGLTPTKTLSETETRIITSYSDPEAIAELFDLTLNPVSHKQTVKHILESNVPYDLNFNIDRSVNPYGNNKSLAVLNHIFTAAGFTIQHTED